MTKALWLHEVDRRGIEQAGGKGANLGEMIKAGMPVPPGFVVPARAYRDHIELSDLHERAASRLASIDPGDAANIERASTEIAEDIEAAPMPAHVRSAIESAYAELALKHTSDSGILRVAVRSSATAEDLPDASFAGQQETYLNVYGAEEVLVAVRRCWASLWAPRAVAYRARMGYDHLAVNLAVVVQAMVEADVAGVMFTANPMSGARDELVVTATYGLGEAVVGGLVTPDTFFLTTEGDVRRRSLGSKEQRIVLVDQGTRAEDVAAEDRDRYCLTEAQLRELADLGRRVAAHYGSPEDIEWAFAGGRLFLLQARPITHLPEPAPEPPKGRERAALEEAASRIMDHFPDPPKPIDFAFMTPANNAVMSLMKKMGLGGAEGVTMRELPDGRFTYMPGTMSPSLAMLWRLPPVLLRAYQGDATAEWEAIKADEDPKLRAIEAKDLTSLTAEGLAASMEDAAAVFGAYMMRRFVAVIPAGIVHEGLLRQWARLAVGGAEAAEVARRLMLSVPYATARMNRDMAALAGTAAKHGKEGDAFREHLERFLAKWGKRSVQGMEPLPGFATWSEDRTAVLGMVEALQRDPAALDIEALERRHAERFAAARDRVLGRLGRRLGALFLKNLEGARSYLFAREEGLLLGERVASLMRRILQELGARLHAEGRLAQPDDVFFLEGSELGPAARGAITVLDRVARRRRAHRSIVAAHERGEHWLISSGTLPWLKKKDAPDERSGDVILTGLGSSPGRATGPVCRVRGPAEFGKLRPGDILVAPATAPTWTPLFGIAAAVVTDTGNVISHAAIVAREYGIPAVLAAGSAMDRLRDGDVITVDGDRGRVTRSSG